MNKVFVIAEAGVNHNGSLTLAKRLVDEAADCGADAIKFQTFNSRDLVSVYASKAEYQKNDPCDNQPQIDLIKKLELKRKYHLVLRDHCRKKKIIFLSSAFDLESVFFLSALGLRIFKIPSGEITNIPYLRVVGSLKKKLILSTGMADIKEVGIALNTLISAGTVISDIVVLHCNTEYPTPIEDVNLTAMLTIRDKFKVKVGYSDHTLGIEIPIAAAALGAVVIEKHFTLDSRLQGPDHKASLEPGEFRKMVLAIRNVELALGDGVKRASKSEKKNIAAARKSIVASRNIVKGEILNGKNLTVKRPGNGISPLLWDSVIGKKAKKDFRADQAIKI
jgi:N,N'-diacetyllegionaminate synthase